MNGTNALGHSDAEQIRISKDLLAELRKIAVQQGRTVADLANTAIRQRLSALRSSVEGDYAVQPGSVQLAPDRRDAELRALRCRLLQRLADYSYCHGEPGDVEKVGKFVSVDRFLALRDVATMLDDGKIHSLQDLPATVTELRQAESLRELALPLESVFHRLQNDEVVFAVEFRVDGRVPLVQSVDFEPFGGASKITLIAGPSRLVESWTSEVIAVNIEIPLQDARSIEEDCELLFEGPVMRCPAMEVARRVLEHILVVLRLHGAGLAYEDFRGDLGVPFRARVIRRFPDGSFADRPARGVSHGWNVGPPCPNPLIAATPLALAPGVFADAYRHARTESALLAGSRFFADVDLARRCLLIIESTFSSMGRVVSGRADPGVCRFAEGLAKLDAAEEIGRAVSKYKAQLGELAEPSQFISEIVDIRNMVSHLQRHEYCGSRLVPNVKPFGLEVYEGDLRQRLGRALPAMHELACTIVSQKVPGLPLGGFRSRDSTLDELVGLLSVPDYFIMQPARTAVVELILRRVAAGERCSSVEELVTGWVSARPSEITASYLAMAATNLSERTRKAGIGMIAPGDEFSRQFVALLVRRRLEFPEAYSALVSRLVELDDEELLTFCAVAEAEGA